MLHYEVHCSHFVAVGPFRARPCFEFIPRAVLVDGPRFGDAGDDSPIGGFRCKTFKKVAKHFE
jgi:hypothetical protein